jgi:hypothetical protein
MGFRFKWRVFASAVLMLAGAAHAVLPAGYSAMFDELSALIDGGDPAPSEMLRGGWLAARYIAPAAEGLAFNRARFAASASPGQAGVSGLFLAVHGSPEDHQLIRRVLETEPQKRSWLARSFGTEEAFFHSLESGSAWSPVLSALPSAGRLMELLRVLSKSPDPLVRRAALCWGWQVADAGYWEWVRATAVRDADPVTRACALRLLGPHRKRPPAG